MWPSDRTTTDTDESRIRNRAVAAKVMSAAEAAAFIAPGDNVGMSGFTGAGYPKAVPAALVERVSDAAARGDRFAFSVWTGASTAPELDGALGGGRRDRTAHAVPVRPGEPRQDQRRSDGLSGPAPVACRSDGVGGLFRPSRRRSRRGRRRHRGRRAHPLIVGRQQQDLDRPGGPRDPRGELLAADRAGGNARHLLRHGAPAAPPADPDPRALGSHRRARTCAARRRRSSPSSGPTVRIATRLSSLPTRCPG